MTKASTLTFLGAAATVTGSRFLLRHGEASALIDCGMFQGRRDLRALNWSAPALDVGELDTVVLTHAHLDHVGYLPVLMRHGFKGTVLAAKWTPELAKIVLTDSGHLQEEEASFANRMGYAKHHPALPLYTEAEGETAARRIRGVAFGAETEVAPGIRATFQPAGHILGSATVQIDLEDGPRILFSGDLGRPHHPILCPPAPRVASDFLVIESTYGNRQHEDIASTVGRLAEAISRTAARGGTVIIPSFAVDRTEVLLCTLTDLLSEGRVPELPVYVDSPMASAVLDVYRRAIDQHDPGIRPGHHPGLSLQNGPHLEESTTREQSIAIDGLETPSIVISSSGMATGGRVLHHLARRLPDHRNMVVLAGYQAEATRGRSLADGARSLKIHGRYVPVRADVVTVDAFSVHADADELEAWMASPAAAPETTFIVHGEPASSEGLRLRVEGMGRLGVVPRMGETVRLS